MIRFVFLAALVASLALTTRLSTAGDAVDFNRDVRPILSDKCFKCHGFDDKIRQAGLRLDTREGQRATLESGAVAVIAGKSGQSELVQRINAADPEERMPPASTGKHLTDAEKKTLARWIDQGADYQPHWSFVPPARLAAPEVKHAVAVRNPIDRFVLAQLAQAGLAPSPPAERVTLIRRVTLDLTGLPATPAEVDAFLADNADGAYERLVDRLLKSPRYGEHMARYWLDAARYGDTHGLHLDNERSMWPYRDYVINAFNSNKRFDQFVVEQMAGDLLPGATLEQRVATGFNRCNVSTGEGGSIDDEVLVRYAVDRVETMSTVFLGLTLGCAVCHTHKFDPITQKEFYQLYAFFSGSADAAMDGNMLLPPPSLKVPSAEQSAQLAALDGQLAAAKKRLADELAKFDYKDPSPTPTSDVAANATGSASAAREHVWIDDDPPPGAQRQGDTPWKFVSKTEFAVHSGEKASTRTADGLSQHFFTGANPPLRIGGGDKLFAHVFIDPKNPPKAIMLQFNNGSWEHRCYWGEDVIPFGAEGGTKAANHFRAGQLPEAGKWVRLEVQAEKVGLNSGAEVNGWAFTQFGGTVYWDKAGVVTRTPQTNPSFESLAAWDAYQRSIGAGSLPDAVKAAVKTDPAKRNDGQKKEIREYFLSKVHPQAKAIFEPLDKEVRDLAQRRKAVDDAIPATLVMAELPKPRDTFILIRGQYDKKGEKVQAAVPAVLGSLAKDAPPNRLGLARWLVDPQHPLTARVTVNRIWQQFFGTGLVKTAEDFGAQGQWPSHPELLDWLARDFIDSGWDVKRFVKLMVMSGTYQQSSRVTPEHRERDPGNELLARGPRFRMDGEMVRDTALFTSGLLVEQIGGRSVKPYQPEGIWESVAFVGSNTQNFKQDKGAALYRRSLYTFWKRTAAHPAMLTFDAPSRESCTVRRARTNTPLQALVLMNDHQYVEASRFFAQRVMTEGGTTPEARLTLAFRLATARPPTPEELGVLVRVFWSHLADFTARPDTAQKLLAVGEAKSKPQMNAAELAAYAMTMNLILNLDETVTKE
jgi:hypothetical protein